MKCPNCGHLFITAAFLRAHMAICRVRREPYQSPVKKDGTPGTQPT